MNDVKFSSLINVNMKILLIEDSPNFMEQMKKDLRSLGMAGVIDEAENIAQGVQAIKATKYDLIISDWNLPDGTGYELLVKFKETSYSKTTPFILCTTIDDINQILKALSAGANEYIVKPWKITELKKKIEAVMGKKK